MWGMMHVVYVVDIQNVYTSLLEGAIKESWSSKENLFRAYVVETVQDFLIKLDIKPLMHLLKISMFSLNNVILRLTKIMNRADKNWAHF